MLNPLPFLSMPLQLPLQAPAGCVAGAPPLACALAPAKKVTWSQQQGIGGETRHNITKISTVRHLLRVCQCLAVLLCMGCVFNARAALNCTQAAPWLDMFAGTYGGFFAFPDDAATLPIGARVGGLREVNLRYNCTGMLTTEKFGTGMIGVNNLTWHAATQTWTNPQLEELGLGFRMWWHEPNGHIDHNPTAHPNSNPTLSSAPVNWYSRPRTAPHLKISTRVIFFKINDNFLDTDGFQMGWQVSVDLFKFYIAKSTDDGATYTQVSPVQTYTLHWSNFSTRRRVCTPLVDQTVNFDSISVDDLPATGVVESSTKAFSLEFSCPHMAYYMMGFKLEGLHGVLDQDNGVFGIKQGPGYASGVGVQFSAQHLATSWRGNPDYSNPAWRVLKPGENYFIPYFEYSTDFVDTVNPTSAFRSRVVNFRAKYYRMPGALQGGTVESKVVVRFVYQ